MTHPLRFKEPYAPKVGEWWEILYDKDVYIVKIKEFYNDVWFINADQLGKRFYPKAFVENKHLIRRHFRDQAERDAAPAIPPVEGARMINRDGSVTQPIEKSMWTFDNEHFEWLESGECFNNTEKFDTIAVHTWPEEVTNDIESKKN